jgi:hypothetical protein
MAGSLKWRKVEERAERQVDQEAGTAVRAFLLHEGANLLHEEFALSILAREKSISQLSEFPMSLHGQE